MDSLTPDLQALVRSGQINFHQAREMMFVPAAGAPAEAGGAAGAAAGDPPRKQPPSSRQRKKKACARPADPQQDQYMTRAILELSKILVFVDNAPRKGSGLLATLPSDVLCPLLTSPAVLSF